MTTILGIDFSLTSPAYTVLSDTQVVCYCVSAVKQTIDVLVSPVMRIVIYPIEKHFSSSFERMEYLARLPCSLAKECDSVAIEDYSFGSVGLVFSIAEITGFVKYKLWEMGKPAIPVPPTAIKKWATGKGNAKKEAMIAAFQEKTGVNLAESLPLNKQKPFSSPISDIVDSYHIACFHHQTLLATT